MRMKNIHFLTNHFEIYFPDEKLYFLPKPAYGIGIKWEATNDVDLILWNPEKKEKKRVLISGRPLVDPTTMWLQ
jgi:hypothetical protein